MVGRRAPQEPPPDRSALRKEREDLIARLAELDRLLAYRQGRHETAVYEPPERA